MTSCFTFEAIKLLENGNVKEKESKDRQLATCAAIFLKVSAVGSNNGASGKPV